MILTSQEADLFFKLHRALMFFVNQRLRILSDDLAGPADFAALPPETRLKVRQALLKHPDLLDSFVTENPAHLSEEELAVVSAWRHKVAGKFYIFRELKKFTVFLSASEPSVAYGVTALTQPFEDLVGPYLPIFVETVLLPFKDKIVYDSLLNGYNISFGTGIRRSLNESYQAAKSQLGIVSSLPVGSLPAPTPRPKKTVQKKSRSSDQVERVLKQIISMTDQFCRQHLTSEYADLCRKLAEKLARKRPSPFVSGQPETWACGIVRTIGWVNFLSDSSQTPHLKLTAIDKAFGVGVSTGQGKSMLIRKMLKIRHFDWHWTLPTRMDDNSLIWLLGVNGFPMDIRDAPREAQIVAYEKGLIPYIPADRVGNSERS